MQLIISLLFITIICANNAKERIVGGEIAIKPIPYQVSIRRSGHRCGGSIIDSTTILTAAHCFQIHKNPNNYTIVVGTKYLEHGGQEYAISAIILHDDFNFFDFANDIAILKTTTPIQFNDRVRPIEIYNGTIPDKTALIVSGWGVSEYPDDDLSDNLKILTVYTINNFFCIQLYKRFDVLVTTSDICTVSRITNGACHGDSGGPLVYKNLLVGLTSRGVECAIGMPDILTNVTAYLDWIHSNSNNVE